jgi:sodium/hydrogen antiporter
MPDLQTAFAIGAIVFTVFALVSGFVDVAPLSLPMVFLGIGFLVGPHGFAIISIGPRDTTLQTVAFLDLALVLFLDAVKLRFDEADRSWIVPVLALGPGTVITLACVALAAFLLLKTSPLQSLLLGTVLASTDPIVLRDVLRDQRLPRSVRRALSIEAGTNDIVVLPILLVLIAVARGQAQATSDWVSFLTRLFVIGPLAGAAVGGVGSWLVGVVDRRFPIRREYQALYGIGLVLGAFAAGGAVGGDGFIAAYAAGLAVTALNNELCDCFMDYGETTSEIAMLLAFVLFGVVLSVIVGSVPLLPVLAFAALVIGVARPLAIGFVLFKAPISREARAFIAWFGPRGLSSLLFASLLVQQGVPGGEGLLAIAGVVVIASVILHGVTATPLTARYVARVVSNTAAEEREGTASGLFQGDASQVPRITPEELAAMMAETPPPLVIDVRTRSQYALDDKQIPNSVRVLPDLVAEWAKYQPKDRLVVAYCT